MVASPLVTLFVARHGRTEANAGGLLLGRADPSLDETGRGQAGGLAKAMPVGARVVSSPLRRCLETAQTIAAEIGSEVETDERLIELDYGEYDLRPLAEIPAAVWAQWRSDPTFRPPGGETLAELGDRVHRCLDELGPDATDGDVIAVTHVSPIKAAVAWALGVGPETSWRCFVAQASLTKISVSAERGPSLQAFNLEDHLN